jgi:hypothetical protein
MGRALHILDVENPRSARDPEYYGRAPQSACNDVKLLHSDRTVLSVLSFLARQTHPIVLATQVDVARRAGMSVQNLRKCYNRLEAAGWIERQKACRKWCTPAQITLLFELRGFQLENDPQPVVSKRTQVDKTKGNSSFSTNGNSGFPTKGNSSFSTNGNSGFPDSSSIPYRLDLREREEREKRKTRGGNAPRTPRPPTYFENKEQERQAWAEYMTGDEGQAMVDELDRTGGTPCPL